MEEELSPIQVIRLRCQICPSYAKGVAGSLKSEQMDFTADLGHIRLRWFPKMDKIFIGNIIIMRNTLHAGRIARAKKPHPDFIYLCIQFPDWRRILKVRSNKPWLLSITV